MANEDVYSISSDACADKMPMCCSRVLSRALSVAYMRTSKTALRKYAPFEGGFLRHQLRQLAFSSLSSNLVLSYAVEVVPLLPLKKFFKDGLSSFVTCSSDLTLLYSLCTAFELPLKCIIAKTVNISKANTINNLEHLRLQISRSKLPGEEGANQRFTSVLIINRAKSMKFTT